MTETFIQGERLILHPYKAIYWESRSILLIADLHLGKARHFRASGIPVPQGAGDSNWDRLISLFLEFKPDRVIFLGDLFHSAYNTSWDEFCQLLNQFHTIQFELVVGNHDILQASHYAKARMTLHPNTLYEAPFLFSHEPLEEPKSDKYNLAGHIHPSVRLKGNGRQYLRLPCFYFGTSQGILPAFGAFTGTATIQPKKGDQVYVIAEDVVMEV